MLHHLKIGSSLSHIIKTQCIRNRCIVRTRVSAVRQRCLQFTITHILHHTFRNCPRLLNIRSLLIKSSTNISIRNALICGLIWNLQMLHNCLIWFSWVANRYNKVSHMFCERTFVSLVHESNGSQHCSQKTTSWLTKIFVVCRWSKL